MYGAEYYAAEYYGAGYYGPGVVAADFGGGWYHAPRKKRPRRDQIRDVVRAAAIKRIDDEPVELIDPKDILARLQESKPILDARLFLRQDDDDEIRDVTEAMIRAGMI